MSFLIFSILCSSAINWIFVLYKKYTIQTIVAIPFNYLICSLLSHYFFGSFIYSIPSFSNPAFLPATFLGVLFIIIFYAMAKTTQLFGVAINVVSSKMAMIIPVIFFIFYSNQQLNSIAFIGIIIALFAILCINSSAYKVKGNGRNVWYPILVFIGSGIIDTSLKLMEITYLNYKSPFFITTAIFSSAFIIGISAIFVQGKTKITPRDVLAGALLGIPNFCSILFFLFALKELQQWHAGQIFAVNHCSIIVISSLGGVVFFKESFSKLQIAGLCLGVLSIVCMLYAF